MKKRILSLVLTLVLILSLVPAPAIAVYDTAAVGDCTITSQPKDVTVNPGQTATFTVAATNPDSTNLKYLWFDADKVMNGRTSFVIAPRLSTIRKADLILVVSDGKIIERGTHAELMRLNGEYRKLYTMQYREEQYRSLT